MDTTQARWPFQWGATCRNGGVFFAPDGDHMYLSPYDAGMDVQIWRVTPDGDLWQDPVPLSGSIAEDPAFYPVMAPFRGP